MKKNSLRNSKKRNTRKKYSKKSNNRKRYSKKSNRKKYSKRSKRVLSGGASKTDQKLHDASFEPKYYEIPVNESNHRGLKAKAMNSVANNPNDKRNLIEAIEIDGAAIINAGDRLLSDDLFNVAIKQVQDDKYIKKSEKEGKIKLIEKRYKTIQAKKKLEISKIMTKEGIDSPAQGILTDPYLLEKVLENFNQRKKSQNKQKLNFKK